MNLADRMRTYEDVWRFTLPRRSRLIVRIDGKAFHSYTRWCEKPFDMALKNAFVWSSLAMAQEIQGFQLGYHQSDEVSFFLHDFAKLDTEPWLGYGLQKLVSVAASTFTSLFAANPVPAGATFDARAFFLPREEVANYFLWRARDWNRNSLFMFARSSFSHKALHGKSAPEMHEMLHGVGKNWTTDVSETFRNGSFFLRERDELTGSAVYRERTNVPPQYEAIAEMVDARLRVESMA